MTERKRITVIFEKANPLFEKWLTEWRDASEEGSNIEKVFNYALSNLQKCKIPLATGQECLILKGFNKKLCKKLDDKLLEHKQGKEKNSVSKKPRKSIPKNYIPSYRSGGYAILIAFYKSCHNDDYNFFLSKDELINLGKPFSDTSFVKPDPGNFYTAWSSMGTLIKKGLVLKQGKASYSLTESGYSVAKELAKNTSTEERSSMNICSTNTEKEVSLPTKCKQQDVKLNDYSDPSTSRENIRIREVETVTLVNDKNAKKQVKKSKTIKKTSSDNSNQSSQDSSKEEHFIFEPNSFNIILIVDTQETIGGKTDIQEDPLLNHLQNNLVLFEVRHLTVGDYAWICRHRHSGKELILPYIIERKRLDDFASSIKDGRYHEQKFRLKKSGIQTVTYLIERIGGHLSLPLATLHQAAANTAIQDGFNVKFTANLKHTVKYLANFSRLLIENYKDKTIASCSKENLSEVNITDDLIQLMTFDHFHKASSKHKALKVSDLFIKMLVQINGMSVEKAVAVVQIYPTPMLLRQAFLTTTPSEGEKLLSKITFGEYNKTIGNVLSKIVYDLFTREKF